MKIRYLICKEYKCVDPYAGVAAAKEDLLAQSFLVVRDKDRFYGILIPGDILQKPRNLVIDCLSPKPVLHPEQTITEVLETMQSAGCNVLPVFDNHVLVGTISRADILTYLNDYQKELEQAVMERTEALSLANKKLALEMEERIRTEKALQETEKRFLTAQKMEAIGMLAGGIAHDFNNILQPLIGYSEMAFADLPEHSRIKGHLEEIHKSALRARDLVKQILSFSRQSEKEAKPIAVQSILKEALKLIRPSLPATIEIRQRIDRACHMVLADPAHIHQIAMNLVTNAYHAMEKTGGTLTVTLTNCEKEVPPAEIPDGMPCPCVEMAVADTGIGMSQQVIEKIFDPFFTTKEEGKGTGLGLSVVYGIIKALNGEITVQSKPGEGTVFKVYLPAYAQEIKPVEAKATHAIPRGMEHLLIVDDEVTIVHLEKAMLERIGYTVEACTSSLDALERFKAAPQNYDLVVTDMTMPKMTGDIFAGLLMQIRKDIPVIICTGYSQHISAEKARCIGIRGFLPKPVVLSEFAKEVRRVLDEAQELKRAV